MGDEIEIDQAVVELAVATPYRHDAFQPLYLMSESVGKTVAEVLALTPEELLAL